MFMLILDVLIFISDRNMQLCLVNSTKQTEYKKCIVIILNQEIKHLQAQYIIQIFGLGGVVVSKLGSRHWHSEHSMS